MFSLDPSISQALPNVESNIPFHARPPVLVAKVLVHFVRTGMNGISGFVGFVHDDLSQICPPRNPDSVQIIEYPVGFAHELSSIVIDSFFLQRTLVKASVLCFADESFEVILSLDVSNTYHVILSAEGVCNYIRLAWVITDLTVVIVEKFYPSALTHIEFSLVKDML